ncbi:helix-turn-helix domain-containing protein [Microbispora rosea]|uniref:helix-turn-helix domain-containing protein n=1 Tax=Microbispora rosea TaxID=58117 RepID=UPI00379E7D17
MRAVPGVVALAVTSDMPMFELSIACEIFGTDRSELADPWYELRLCAARPGTTRTQNGFALHTPYDFHALTTADTVVVPAIPADAVLAGDTARMNVSGLPEALRAAHANGARIVSLCTGAFVLAAAGLLDERRATTHWMYTGILGARHPRVRVDPAVLYVDEGDVLTSAGRSAGIDLCLHLVRTDLGAEVANQVARRMVTPAHRPGGQAQYIEAPVPRCGDDGLAPVLQWALEHLHRQLTVAQMAAWASVSTRTLFRRFHAATGTTPLRWLHAQRLARARHLLETTDLPIEQVSRLCGMGTAGNLRHHFTRSAGVAPMDYRRAFHGRPARTVSADSLAPPHRADADCGG